MGVRWRSPLGPDPDRRRISRCRRICRCRAAGGCTCSWGRTCEGAVAEEGCSGGAAARCCCCCCWSRRGRRGCCSRRRARAGWRRRSPRVSRRRSDTRASTERSPGELVVTDFHFDGGADKARIRIASMTVDPTLMMLFSRVLRIDNARVQGLDAGAAAGERRAANPTSRCGSSRRSR